jgi:molybdate transport system substrate-binding protein
VQLRQHGRARVVARCSVVILAVAAVVLMVTPSVAADDVLIFAAASLTNAIDAMKPLILEDTGVAIRSSYASSAVLAKQIEAGAPADLFISADTEWMDYLVQRKLVVTPVYTEFASNSLVLVAPASSAAKIAIRPGMHLSAMLGGTRLAVGDPASVPAGKYAKAALEHLNAWDDVKDHLAPSENVRAALQLVSRGEAALGIVYSSDATVEPAVRVVATFPPDSHPPIVYPAAKTTRGGGSGPGRVLAWLKTAAAKTVLARYGFETSTRTTTTR